MQSTNLVCKVAIGSRSLPCKLNEFIEASVASTPDSSFKPNPLHCFIALFECIGGIASSDQGRLVAGRLNSSARQQTRQCRISKSRSPAGESTYYLMARQSLGSSPPDLFALQTFWRRRGRPRMMFCRSGSLAATMPPPIVAPYWLLQLRSLSQSAFWPARSGVSPLAIPSIAMRTRLLANNSFKLNPLRGSA